MVRADGCLVCWDLRAVAGLQLVRAEGLLGAAAATQYVQPLGGLGSVGAGRTLGGEAGGRSSHSSTPQVPGTQTCSRRRDISIVKALQAAALRGHRCACMG